MSHSPTGLPTQDWCKIEHAEMLAMRIRNYWAIRGEAVKTEIPTSSELGEGYWQGVACIRSNMSGGWPPADPDAPVNLIACPTGNVKTRVTPSHAMVRP